MQGLSECMTIANDGELSMYLSLPPPLAEDVVRVTTALSHVVGFKALWIGASGPAF